MYEIAQTYLRLDLNASEDFKQALEKYLLYKGKVYFDEFFNRELVEGKIFFQVELENGSLKARLKVLGKLAIAGVITYGGIRSGIDYIIKDSRTFSEHVSEDLRSANGIDPLIVQRVERRLGLPGKIRRLLADIDHLQKNRSDLTETQQQQIINKISGEFNFLIEQLDPNEVQLIQNEMNQPLQRQILSDTSTEPSRPTLPEGDNVLRLPSVAIREEELKIVSEDNIEIFRRLPPPK